MLLGKLHSRIVRRLINKYWAEPSIDFGSAHGHLQKDIKFTLAVDGFLDGAAKYVPFKKINLDEFPYPLEDKKYKLITCLGTIHFLKYPDKFLEEAYRIGTDDTTLIISLTLAEWVVNLWSWFWKVDSSHRKMFESEFNKMIQNQKMWKLIEIDSNINKVKLYYVFKKA
jgi:hypothetical protein